jgi:PAS domain-containing protein
MRRVIAAMMVGAVGSLLLLQWLAPGQTLRLAGPVPFGAVAMLGWYLMSEGRLQFALKSLIFGLWVVVTVVVAFTGGVHAPMVVAYLGFILMVGLLTRRSQTLWVGAMTVLVTAGFVAADSWGALPEPLATTAIKQGLDQILVYLLCIVLGLSLVQAYQARLTTLRKVSADLARRGVALEASQAELKRAQSVANVGNWVGDMASDTMRASDEMMRIFGLAQDRRMSYSDYKNLVHPEDRGALDLAWRAALKGASFDEEHRVVVNGGAG